MRLITIPFSHYCEKARWALQRSGATFVEEGHLPMLHWRATRKVKAGRTVPVLITDDVVLGDSTDILRYMDRICAPEHRLYPSDVEAEVLALEDRFDEVLGPHTRRIGYYYVLPQGKLLMELVRGHIPGWELHMFRATYPVASAMLGRKLRINRVSLVESMGVVDTIWSEVDARLADGRPYLAGGRFTAADLTLAALSGFLLFPPEHPIQIPDHAIAKDLGALRDRLRGTRTGEFVLRMYRDHRPARLIEGRGQPDA